MKTPTCRPHHARFSIRNCRTGFGYQLFSVRVYPRLLPKETGSLIPKGRARRSEPAQATRYLRSTTAFDSLVFQANLITGVQLSSPRQAVLSRITLSTPATCQVCEMPGPPAPETDLLAI